MILRLYSVVGFAEPALPLIGHTPEDPQTFPRGSTHSNPFGVIASGHREVLLALLAPGKTVPPYHPSWKQRSLWNGSGTLKPTHYVCYIPEAKGGHAKSM